MNTPDTRDFDRVWTETLSQVRRTRRGRQLRRAAFAGLAGAAVILLGARWLPEPSAPPEVFVATAADPPPPAGRIAVYRLDAAGNLRMEEVGAAEIPPLEMASALSPVLIADHWD